MKFYLLITFFILLSSCKTIQLSPPPGQIGLQIRSLNSGKVLYEINPEQKLVPASTAKLFTLAAALKVLGPSYQFETRVFFDGRDLYLKGSGDPSFSTSDLDNLASQIKQLVHKPIRNIVIDDTVFDRNYYGNGWWEEDYDRGFSAPISGINVNYNRVVVGFLSPSQIVVDPLTRFVKLDRSTPGKFTLKGHGIDVAGEIPCSGFPVYQSYAAKNPPQWAGFLFREALQRFGIRIRGKILESKTPEDLKPITSHQSIYLSEMLISFTKFSNNLGNEALLKVMGNGSFEKGLEVVQIQVGQYHIADGSGLSRLSSITPAQMTDFLLEVARDFQISPEFMTALPIAGRDGSLQRSFKQTPFASNLRAKTGGMTGISGMAGYYKKPDGEMVVFSLFGNDLENGSSPLRNWFQNILLKL